jgi:hypothetical protein
MDTKLWANSKVDDGLFMEAYKIAIDRNEGES